MNSHLAYLQELTIRLATGVGLLPQARRDRHVAFICRRQQSDGGFAGREGGSDPYYTTFALRALSVLGELHGPLAERAGGFIRSRLAGQETLVDMLSLIYGAALLDAAAGIDVFDRVPDGWKDRVAENLEGLRRDDGGYAKGPDGQAGSTYQTFLVAICLQLLQRPLPQPERVIAFLHSQRAEEGGFREIRAAKRAGTNPTAAAVALLKILGALDPATVAETVDFLEEMQTDEGGLRANTRIPIADLLSSFTGLLTLIDLGSPDAIDLRELNRFARRLEAEAGGFYAADWDEALDVEYTFYGLGCQALVQTVQAQSPE